MRFSKKTILLTGVFSLFLVISVTSSYAQVNHISGTVIDNNNDPVTGAIVFEAGTDNGVQVDANGAFSLNLTGRSNDVTVSCIGYITQTYTISGTQENGIVIRLKEEYVNLDESVVVGYGEFSRKVITSAVAKISGETLENTPFTAMNEGLKGKIPGLYIVQTDNTPGGSFSLKIRGGSSITNSNDPLIYVDGVERGTNSLNTSDIESIQVLKDAAASAIYGARGSNGVILITTKRGKYNQPLRVTFEATLAYQEVETKLSFLNSEDYINLLRPAIAISQNPEWNYSSSHSVSSNNGTSSIYSTRYYNEGDVIPDGWKTMADPLDPSKTLMFCDTDWQAILFKPSLFQNYNVGVSGGTQNIRYSGSIGYVNDQGVGLNTGYKRLSFATNVEAKITKFLTAETMVNYQYVNQDEFASQMNAISRGLSAPPTEMVYYDDGTPTEGYNSSSETPLHYVYYRDRADITKNLSIAGGLTWKILEGWEAKISGSYYDTNQKIFTFRRANVWTSEHPSAYTLYETQRLKCDFYTQYDHTFGKSHNFNAMLGYTYAKRKYDYLYARGTGSVSDKIKTINGSTETESNSNMNSDVALGFFGRINYDYKQKYLVTVVARYDASSKFMKANRWGFFPGVSAGWIISEEPWMEPAPWISYLKARVSYGQTGNNGIGVNDAMGAYTASYSYNGNAAIRGTTMPNEDLQWETTTQLDVGVEFGLFNNRVYFSGDFYNKYTENLLYDMNLPNTSGYSSVTTNLGTVRFWGWEFQIDTKNIDTKNFQWSSTLTFSYNKNVVVKLPDNGVEGNRTGVSGYTMYSRGDGTYFGGLAEGEPLYRFYGYNALGVFQTDEEAANAPYDESAIGYDYRDGTTVAGRKFAGDYNWEDVNGDGRINSQDYVCLGVTEPKAIGGFLNTLSYKNFTLSIYLDYALGHYIFDESYGRYFYGTFSGNYALVTEAKTQTWQYAGDNSKYAKFWANDSGAGQRNFNRVCNVFTYKGDYLCIRDITLQYDFPKKICSKMKMQDLQIYVSGGNLYYFTYTKGISPEIGTSSTYSDSYANYPPVRKISLGLKVTF